MTAEALPAGFQCAGCGEWNATVVDPGGGRRQSYVEDCQVCCRPNLLSIVISAEGCEVQAELES